jgi:hypothetical protein
MKNTFRCLLCLTLISCAPRPVIETPEVSYSDQWLQLDDYFADSCFILETPSHTVWVFDEGEEEQTHKDDWEWEFREPDLYLFNGSINLYSVPTEDDCWWMNIWEVDVRACPCRLPIPARPDPEEEE